MTRDSSYQPPEIVRIGLAEEMTLGMGPTSVPDGCDCTKATSSGEEIKVGGSST
jgi:hypothetical protein